MAPDSPLGASLDNRLAVDPRRYLRVSDIMSRQITRIRQDANLFHAAEIVALSGVGDLMVVDDAGNFVGVLSVGDILRAALPNMDEILAQTGSLDDAFQLFISKGRDLASQPIMPLVIREPIVVDPDDHVAKAVTVLIDHSIGRLPVLKDRRLVGTVSRTDICWAVVGEA
jgi:CBS domain-containing protein